MSTFIPLTQAQKTRFQEDGLLILKNVLDEQEVAHIIEAGDKLYDDVADGYRLNHGAWDGISNCILHSQAFRPLLTKPQVLSALTQLLGPRIQLLASQYIRSRSLTAEEVAAWKPLWHRDLYGTTRDLGSENLPLMAIKCGFILTDHLDADSGITLYAPGTHLERQGRLVPEGQVHPPSVIEPRVRAGDVIMFENRTGHSHGRNTSGRTRRCVMINFGYRWLMPFDYHSYEDEFQQQCSPLERALFAAPRFPMAAQDPCQPLIEWAADAAGAADAASASSAAG